MTTPITLPGTNAFKGYDLDHLGNWKKSPSIPAPAPGSSSASSSSSSGDEPAVAIDRRDHNTLNQITRRKTTVDGPWVPFVYDKNGNLLDDGERLMAYDAFNRLVRVRRKSDDAVIGQYVYDAGGRRIRKTVNHGGLSGNIPGGTTDFAYFAGTWQDAEDHFTPAPGSSSSSSSSSPTPQASSLQYVWGIYIDELIQQRDALDGETADRYMLSNMMYSARALTDAQADIVEAYDTDPYGNWLAFSSPGADDNWWGDDATTTNIPACNLLHQGLPLDVETHIINNRMRMYYPQFSWLQREPLGYTYGMNLHQYLLGNPTIATDPTGRDPSFPPMRPRDIPPEMWPVPPAWTPGSGYPYPRPVSGLIPEFDVSACIQECSRAFRQSRSGNSRANCIRRCNDRARHRNRNRRNYCPRQEPITLCIDHMGIRWTRDNRWGEKKFHGGHRCYRSGHFQCCYGPKGRLITSGPYQGTYDYSPYNPVTDEGSWDHYWDDVFPHHWDDQYADNLTNVY